MRAHEEEMRLHRGHWIIIYALGIMAVVAVIVYVWQLKFGVHKPGGHVAQKLQTVKSVSSIKPNYDVIVVGTDPEGVAAAISAARNGQKTLLVDGNNRDILGGLMTLGWLNSLDMNIEPGDWAKKPMNKGIFSEWFAKIEGDSFDVVTAANAFNQMVAKEKNIDVFLKAKSIEPVFNAVGDKRTVTGAVVTKADGTVFNIKAKSVIDATQDADFAAATGVPFTMFREDLADPKSRMAVTAVFRLTNITPDKWKELGKAVAAEDKGQGSYGSNDMSIWGFIKMQDYPAVNKERVRMRGLNGGRQNDNTMLVNALQIFGVDPFDPKSREEAFQIAKDELPHVLEYLKKQYPEFEGVELGGIAPELYVRESRHMIGEYRLSMIDVLENRDQWDRIAFGGYPVDIQRTSPKDNGAVVSDPDKYAIPLRSIVPQKVDGLLVVGRAASFDTLPHGSARVIPVGMATGEAAGAAAKIAADQNMTFRQLSASKDLVAKLQAQLNKQGMDLKPYTPKPAPFMENKTYPGLKTAVMFALATGGYKNEFDLDKASNIRRMLNLVEGTRKFSPQSLGGSAANWVNAMKEPEKQPVTLEQASYILARTLKLDVQPAGAAAELEKKGFVTRATLDMIASKQSLTNGETYMMLRDVATALKIDKAAQ